MGGNVLFDPIVRDRVEKLLQSGVGLTAIHWSTGADQKLGDLWLNTLLPHGFTSRWYGQVLMDGSFRRATFPERIGRSGERHSKRPHGLQ